MKILILHNTFVQINFSGKFFVLKNDNDTFEEFSSQLDTDTSTDNLAIVARVFSSHELKRSNLLVKIRDRHHNNPEKKTARLRS
jgi:hypothetical protein